MQGDGPDAFDPGYFAARAVSSEGKIQVELAQLRYRASRLVGLGHSLSASRRRDRNEGPERKKLEMDRRLIRERISRLKKELKEVEQHRELIRTQRKRVPPESCCAGRLHVGRKEQY